MTGISSPPDGRRRRPIVAVLVALVATLASLVAAGCGSSDNTESAGASNSGKSIKVGYIYLGVPGDAGWNRAQDEGRKYVEKNVPGVQTIVLQNIAEANAAQAVQELVSKGCKIIFATSFGYGPGVLRVARQNPDVVFEHAAGIKTAKNVSTYFAEHWEAIYLLGMLAAHATKTNTVGYVGSFPIGEVVGQINAFALGAQSVKPDIKVKTVLISSWDDPPKERQAASALIGAGADSLLSINDSPSVLQQAVQDGKTASTQWSDQTKFGPSAFLSGMVLQWGPYMAQQVKAARDGTWKSEDHWGTVADGMITLAPYGKSVSAAAKKDVDAKLQGFKDGSFNPFKGPIKDQSGAVKVPEGKEMSLQEIANWSWYVQGVEGKIG